jgi:hypothetical protein
VKEQARLASEKFLWDSKINMRHSMYMVEEYIQNEDKALIYTKNTTINLSKGGNNFFIAHIREKKRYLELVDIKTSFIDRTVAKVRQEGLKVTAGLLDQNKLEFKQYLIKNNWTEPDMTGHWQTDQDKNHVFGKITNGLLRNTKGVMIDSIGVDIAQFDQDGHVTRPCIDCSADKFRIKE